MVVVLPVVLADSLAVLAPLAHCHLLVLVLAQWVDAAVEFPAPVLWSAVGVNVTAASKISLVEMMTSIPAFPRSLTTKPFLIFSSMVPLPPSILKQLANLSG